MNNASYAGPMPTGLVSLEQYTSAHFVIYQVISPMIALIGILGNGMSLFILTNNNAKYAFATYLKALTITDICVLIVALLSLVLICPVTSSAQIHSTHLKRMSKDGMEMLFGHFSNN